MTITDFKMLDIGDVVQFQDTSITAMVATTDPLTFIRIVCPKEKDAKDWNIVSKAGHEPSTDNS